MPLLNQVEYAKHLNRSKQYVNKLVREKKIELNGDGKIDSIIADATLAAIRDPSREGVVQSNAKRYGLSPMIEPRHDEAALAEAIAHEQAIMANLPNIPSPPPPPLRIKIPVFADEKARREQAMADTALHDLAIKRGQYVERVKVGSLMKAAGKSWRGLLTEVQSTLPQRLIGSIKQHAPTFDGDILQQIEHDFRLMIQDEHRRALAQVAEEVANVAKSIDTPAN